SSPDYRRGHGRWRGFLYRIRLQLECRRPIYIGRCSNLNRRGPNPGAVSAFALECSACRLAGGCCGTPSVAGLISSTSHFTTDLVRPLLPRGKVALLFLRLRKPHG